jgi:hypothetical protein
MGAHNLQIGINSNQQVIFKYVLDGNAYTLECSPEQARAMAAGFNKAADVLQPTRKLYAVAYEKVVTDTEGKRTWAPGGVEHMHAENVAEAKVTFYQSRGLKAANTRIVACAPVVLNPESNNLVKLSA